MYATRIVVLNLQCLKANKSAARLNRRDWSFFRLLHAVLQPSRPDDVVSEVPDSHRNFENLKHMLIFNVAPILRIKSSWLAISTCIGADVLYQSRIFAAFKALRCVPSKHTRAWSCMIKDIYCIASVWETIGCSYSGDDMCWMLTRLHTFQILVTMRKCLNLAGSNIFFLSYYQRVSGLEDVASTTGWKGVELS